MVRTQNDYCLKCGYRHAEMDGRIWTRGLFVNWRQLWPNLVVDNCLLIEYFSFICLFFVSTVKKLIFYQVWFKNRRAKVRQQQQNSEGKPKPKKKPPTPKDSPKIPVTSGYPQYPSCGANIWSPVGDQSVLNRPPPYAPSLMNNPLPTMGSSSSMLVPGPPPPPPRYCSSSQDYSYMSMHFNPPPSSVSPSYDYLEHSGLPTGQPLSMPGGSNISRVQHKNCL